MAVAMLEFGTFFADKIAARILLGSAPLPVALHDSTIPK